MIYYLKPRTVRSNSDQPSSNYMDPLHHRLRSDLMRIYSAGIESCSPQQIFEKTVRIVHDSLQVQCLTGRRLVWPLDAHPKVWILAAGKAAAGMADALYPLVQDRVAGGLIVTPPKAPLPVSPLPHMEAGHPLPDNRGVMAARAWSSVMRMGAPGDLIFVLLSGGASALLPSPVDGVSLEDKANLTQMLLLAGADIHEINSVRKHLSTLKGGRSLLLNQQATVLTLLLSDVAGNDLSAIASGPTVPDSSTYSHALSVIHSHNLASVTPPSIMRYLNAGAEGLHPETPKPGDPIFRRSSTVLLADNRQLLSACSDAARELGYNARILEAALHGDAARAGTEAARWASEIRKLSMPMPPPACIIAGGETTVAVTGHGKGGRNQHAALAAAYALAGCNGCALLFGSSDGVDGPTQAAGGLAFADSLARARNAGISIQDSLSACDSFNALSRLNDAIVTGPTGTNVLDVSITLVQTASH